MYVPDNDPPKYKPDTSPMDPRAKLVFFVVLPILFFLLIGSVYVGVAQGGYESNSFFEPVQKFATDFKKSFRDTFNTEGKFPREAPKLPSGFKDITPSATEPTVTAAPTKVPSATPAPAVRITSVPQQRDTETEYQYVEPTAYVFPTYPPGSLGSKEWKEEFDRKYEETKKQIEESRKKMCESNPDFCN